MSHYPATAADTPAEASVIAQPANTPNSLNPATNGDIQPNGHSTATPDAPQPSSEQPPLPPDAPVPPSPSAGDEPPPSLPPSAIPSAVLTPDVITLPGEAQLSAASPATAEGQAQGSAAPVSTSAQTQGSEAMDLDTPVSTQSIKRPGEDLEQEREEKRAREEDASLEQQQAPAGQPPIDINVPLVGPDGQPLPPPAWLSYVPPPPRPTGPTTPLTLTQHKYILNAVRSLKKRLPDAYNFLVPVDTVRFNIPHYHQVIEKPMDLGTVETKLVVSDPRGPPKDKSKMSKWDTSKGRYGSVAEVAEDVRRIWENSRKFNGANHPVSLSATKLEEAFERSLYNLPPEPTFAPPPPPVATPGSSAHARRPSMSQPPTIRRSSDDTRPKREIHPPPSKDLAWEESPGGARKPKRRSDPQLQWANRVIKSLEATTKYYAIVSHFLYPVEQLVAQLPDYATVIKRPIDLNHIKQKLTEGLYDDVQQVDEDMRLMASNAMKFNPVGHEVHTSATQLLQVWDEKWRSLPPKADTRESSEDVDYDDYSSDEDTVQLRALEAQAASINSQISSLRSRINKRRASRGNKRANKPKGHSHKPSVSKHSPSLNGGSSQNRKPSKKSGAAHGTYRDDLESEDEDEEDDEEEVGDGMLSHGQKQELAEKIGQAGAQTLQDVVEIIQQTTNLGSENQEIELDIDSLPAATISRLYNLVCRGQRGGHAKRGRGSGKKATGTGRKAMGGVSRRSVNEREEAERIRKMEAQLQAFSGQGAGMQLGQQAGAQGGANGFEEDSSSEEESSEEE
ncbi:hypothetical protein I350_08025 [Cryptococcus amylolentus CBS 6273]|uniref:Bromo domain-containing protein n=1 Tax=Cryptococcus amylolentus CBS 6273 TaxID=1296118 RepID=A0A1E3JA99_9TREE|nr:hypothetical protein I350_08025 [Cryptococcus amylolentus CBS 6273]